MLKIAKWSQMTGRDREQLAGRGSSASITAGLQRSIAELVEDVRERGDAAVCDALLEHDAIKVEPAGLRVSDTEFATARARVGADLRAAISHMIANITAFNEVLLARRGSWTAELSPGHSVGEQVGPIDSVALFCPSGKASYPSVLAQVATPAVVAGVPDIIVVVPPAPGGLGEIDPAVLEVAAQLGLERVYRVNGPAGVAAAAFGTETIPACSKVIGPGSPPVALAQLEVRRHGTDTVVLGPSEAVIIADDSVEIDLLAADLLNEAEHGVDSTVVLITPYESIVADVTSELLRQARDLPLERRLAAEQALGVNGGAIVVESLDQAFEVANWFAPEHVQLAISDARSSAGRITNAGEILMGQSTPISAANFLLGCPAALPTGGFAKRASGITVVDFLKSTSVGHFSAEALEAVAKSTIALAEHEGFPAHANAIRIRTVR